MCEVSTFHFMVRPREPKANTAWAMAKCGYVDEVFSGTRVVGVASRRFRKLVIRVHDVVVFCLLTQPMANL